MSEEGAKLQYDRIQLERVLAEVHRQELDIRTYISLIQDAIQAITAIKSGGSSSSMITLGAGVMVKANIQPDSTVLVLVGGGTVIEMSVDTATNYLETRLSEKNATLNNLVALQNNTIGRLNLVNNRLSKLVESEGRSTGN